MREETGKICLKNPLVFCINLQVFFQKKQLDFSGV